MDYQIRVKLKQEQIFFGPGVARLLRGIEHTGSLQAAAAEMGMSYSKAWRILHTAERELGFLLVHRRAAAEIRASPSPALPAAGYQAAGI